MCIILPQRNGYIKNFDDGRKNMSLNTRFHSKPIHDDKYTKTKVKRFSGMINTLFSNNEIPNERNHYICIASICIDSILKVDKKNYSQVYLEQCKYKIKR